MSTVAASLGPGAAAVEWLCVNGTAASAPADAFRAQCVALGTVLQHAGCQADGSDCMLRIRVSHEGAQVHENVSPLAPPTGLRMVSDPGLQVSVSGTSIVLETQHGTAVFVVLTTMAVGRFSDNAIMVVPGEPVTLKFIPFDGAPFDPATLKATLRTEYLQQML